MPWCPFIFKLAFRMDAVVKSFVDQVENLRVELLLSTSDEQQVTALVHILNKIAELFEITKDSHLSEEAKEELKSLSKARSEYMVKMNKILEPEVRKEDRPSKRLKSSLEEEDELRSRVKSDTYIAQPNVRMNSIAGLDDAKAMLQEAVILPHVLPNYFSSKIREPWKGVLLYGPPGTGKSTIAKAVATECGCSFFYATPSTFSSKWVGEAEKCLKHVFEIAQENSPAVIFFDEIDALASMRGSQNETEGSRKIKTELLLRLDDIQKSTSKITVLAATNFPWQLDAAFLRRFEQRVLISLPKVDVIEKMLKLKLSDVKVSPSLDYQKIATLLEGFSGSDINNLCKSAATENMRRRTQGLSLEEIKKLDHELVNAPVTEDDFRAALLRIKKSVSPANLQRYNQWNSEHGSLAQS